MLAPQQAFNYPNPTYLPAHLLALTDHEAPSGVFFRSSKAANVQGRVPGRPERGARTSGEGCADVRGGVLLTTRPRRTSYVDRPRRGPPVLAAHPAPFSTRLDQNSWTLASLPPHVCNNFRLRVCGYVRAVLAVVDDTPS